MAEYAFMKALEVWYERIDVDRLVNSVVTDEKERARIEKQNRAGARTQRC